MAASDRPQARRRGISLLALSIFVAVISESSARDLVVTEISPAPPPGHPEFIELFNPSPRPLELDGWSLTGSIEHRLRSGLVVAGRSYAVLTRDPDLFQSAYGFAADGVFTGELDDDGAEFEIRDGAGHSVTRLRYALDPDSRAFGSGATLEVAAEHLDTASESSWEASWRVGGTPGRENSRALRVESDPVVPEGGGWRFFKGVRAPSGDELAWTRLDHDDSEWLEGATPIGHGNFGDRTDLEDMKGNYTTVYLRRRFSYSSLPENIIDVLLTVVFDDGFVAYLNGTEIARVNMGAPETVVPHDGVSTGRQESEGEPFEFHRPELAALLREGDNVLAVQAANDHVRGGDFRILPALTVISSSPVPPAIVLNELWREGERAFVELFNTGRNDVDLGGYQIRDASRATQEGPRVVLSAGSGISGGTFEVVEVPPEFAGTRLVLTGPDDRLLIDAVRFPPAESGTSLGRFPDGAEDVRLLRTPTPRAANDEPAAAEVVISEIHYHPEDGGDEFVELTALADADLSGWRLLGAIEFDFPSGTSLPSHARLVVARKPKDLRERGIERVLGPFDGRLANDTETLLLADAFGRTVDRVRYADDGAWSGEADGDGPSLELVDPTLENEAAAAWRASAFSGGTPGGRNSVAADASAPLIWRVEHRPLVPRPGDPVEVSARATGASGVDLLYRLDGEEAFNRVPMRQGTGFWRAFVPPQPEGSLVEYALEACAAGDRTGCALSPPGEPGTYLFEVDSQVDSPLHRTYRILLRGADSAALDENVYSNVLRPCTFIGLGGAYHDVRIRYRGSGSRDVEPKSYRVVFTDEHRFPDGKVIFLGGFRPERQVMGMDLWRRIGSPYSRARMVQVVRAGQKFPHYSQVEPIDDAYLERHFGDGEGNLYRGRDNGDLRYLGEDAGAYADLYEKATNEDEADYSDLIELCRAFATAGDADFRDVISELIDTDQWLLWLAVNAILSNQEGGLHRDTGDDYFIYRPRGERFVLLPWDMDSTYLEPEERIFRPSLPAIRRLLTHPDFAPRYYELLTRVIEDYFTVEQIARQVALLELAYSEEVLDEFVTFTRIRRSYIERSIPKHLTAEIRENGWGTGETLYARGAPFVLGGRAPAARTRAVEVGGVATLYDPETASWSVEVDAGRARADLAIVALDADRRPVDQRRVSVRLIGADHVITEIPSGTTEWTEDRSPYILTGDLKVEKGSRLVVRAGSRVLLPPGGDLLIDGALDVEGEESNRVEFQLAAADGLRRTLHFQSGSRGEIAHCGFGIEDHDDPLTPERPFIINEKGELRVRSTSFSDIRRIVIESIEGHLEVFDSVFLGTGEAIHGVESTVIARGNLIRDVEGDKDAIDLDGDRDGEPGASRLEANTIVGGSDDGIDLLDSSAVIAGNHLFDVGDRALSIEGPGQPRIERNLIVRCRSGISVKDGTDASGAYNTVTGCLTGMHFFVKNPGAPGARGSFHSSLIWSNGRDVRVDDASHLDLDHCDVGESPERWGESNFSAPPFFAGATDYRLRDGSPCIGSGMDGTDVGALGQMSGEAPLIERVAPSLGAVAGGTQVVIEGVELSGVEGLWIDGQPVTDLEELATGALWAIVPPARRAGPVPVEITTTSGTHVLEEGYSYSLGLSRGDADGDLRLSVADAIAILRFLFQGADLHVCESVADLDESGDVGVVDVVTLLRRIFMSGAAPGDRIVNCRER